MAPNTGSQGKGKGDSLLPPNSRWADAPVEEDPNYSVFAHNKEGKQFTFNTNLVNAMAGENKDLQIAGLLGTTKALTKHFNLSKAVVKAACMQLAPAAPMVSSHSGPSAASSTEQKKKRERKPDCEDVAAIKADVAKYPLDQRGKDSHYALDIRAARAANRARRN